MRERKEIFKSSCPSLLTWACVAAIVFLWVSLFFDFLSSGRGQFNLNLFFGGAIGSIPLGMLFSLVARMVLDGKGLKSLLFVVPKIASVEMIKKPYETYVPSFLERLAKERFVITEKMEEVNTIMVKVEKANLKPVIGFTDHKFTGEFTVEKTEEGNVRVQSLFVFGDLALVETGETADLEVYLSNLLGIDEKALEKDIPFTLLSGVCLALAAMIFLPFSELVGLEMKTVLISLGLASIGMIGAGVFHVTKNRNEAHGLVLGFVGIFLSLNMTVIGFQETKPDDVGNNHSNPLQGQNG